MSIRAYRLIEIKHAKNPTFNYSQDWQHMSDLIENETENMIDFNRENVAAEHKKLIEKINGNQHCSKEQLDRERVLSAILKDCEETGEENITYILY